MRRGIVSSDLAWRFPLQPVQSWQLQPICRGAEAVGAVQSLSLATEFEGWHGVSVVESAAEQMVPGAVSDESIEEQCRGAGADAMAGGVLPHGVENEAQADEYHAGARPCPAFGGACGGG